MSIFNKVLSSFNSGGAGDLLLGRMEKLDYTKEEKADMLLKVYQEEKAERDAARTMYSSDSKGQIWFMKFMCILFGILLLAWISHPLWENGYNEKVNDNIEKIILLVGGVIVSIGSFYYGSSAAGNGGSHQPVINPPKSKTKIRKRDEDKQNSSPDKG